MRIVALEEHFIIPSLVRGIDPEVIVRRGYPAAPGRMPQRQLAELDAGRIADMDEAGISVQVLSASGPGADLLDGAEGIALARNMNDTLATAVAAYPDRLAAFAHLPMRSSEAAADELERSVNGLGFCGALINGLTQDRFLDHPDFEPILARAERLDVPIYLHPNLPPQSVRDAYYGGLPGLTGFRLATAAWGWHSEVAIHVLRLVLSGALDRHPRLKLIIGHMGEGLPAMLVRSDAVLSAETSHLTRSVGQTIRDQVSITTSGLFTLPPFEVALAVFGIDRVMFSIDYPYSSNRQGRDLLDALALPASDLEKIAHANADQMLKLSRAAT